MTEMDSPIISATGDVPLCQYSGKQIDASWSIHKRGCCEEKQFGNEPTGKTCSISKHLSSHCSLMPGSD
jgi:hypothetical protein